jgi:hypothetical protein
LDGKRNGKQTDSKSVGVNSLCEFEPRAIRMIKYFLPNTDCMVTIHYKNGEPRTFVDVESTASVGRFYQIACGLTIFNVPIRDIDYTEELMSEKKT